MDLSQADAGDDPSSASAGPPALQAHGITKRFPGGVVANEGVDLEVRRGEVHALLGENGAGKSTLSNVFTGLYRADEGHLEVDGTPVAFSSPRDAIAAGIGMVHQHFRLVDTFTVAENVALGDHGRFSRRAAEETVAELGERYGLGVDPSARIWQLSVGQQQRVEILKALSREARTLILDEPTAVLTPQEADSLFEVLRRMTAEGRSVIFISHKLDEVRAVADRVTVLRDGRAEGTRDVAGATSRELARLMVGREVLLGADPVERTAAATNEVRLALAGVTADGDRGEPALQGIDLEVRAGEVLGVCGVAGNGQRELAEIIGGTRAATGGTVTIGETPLRRADPRRAQRAGLALVPEDRLHTGLAPSLPVEDNLALTAYRRPPLATGPFVRRRRVRARAEALIADYDVRCPGPTTPTRVLSGGNVQKVLLARELSSDPAVLVAASPTRGLDVGAIETVRTLLVEAAERGVAVLLLSEDLDEILSLSDRVAVIYEGRIVASMERADADVEDLGLLMGGGHVVIGRATGLHLERRIDRPRWLLVVVPIASFAVALVIAAVVLALAGQDPWSTYREIVDRGFLADGALSATLVAASPLLFTGLAAAAAFRMGIFNIGGDGQLIVGAIGATWAGLTFGDGPTGVTMVAMLLAGGLAGAAWAGIAGALRAWLNTNEIITTLMLNYIALNLATYLIFGSESSWRKLDGTGLMFPQGKPIPDRAEWPVLTVGDLEIPSGFLIGAVVAIGLFVLFRSTRFGFQVRVIGDEPRAARHAGMRTKRTIFALLALSGAVAGLGGASDVGDTRHVLDPKALGQTGYGYAGIVVAALARLNPIAVIFVSILMGGLANAGRALQGPDFPAGLVGTLQGLLLVCTLAGELFARYRLRRTPGLQVDDEPTPTVAPSGASA